jgi:hypothetical protein
MWHSTAAEESKKERCSSAAFLKLFMFREAGTQVPLVTMSDPPQEPLLHLLVYPRE